MKKTLLCVLMLMLLLCFAACGNDTPEVNEPGNGTDQSGIPEEPLKNMITVGTICNAPVVNIRVEATTEGRVIDNAVRGQMFAITEYTEDSVWHRVNYKGEIGYINAEYMYVAEWEDGEQITLATVTDSVNVRKNPATTGAVIINALKGEQYLVLEEDDGSGWYKVGFPEGMGYISAEYLEIETLSINDALVNR